MQTISPVLLDSVTQVQPAHAGFVVVTGSHGGTSSGRYALAVRAALYAFNDAGIGKDEAGIAALAMLDRAGIPAVTVAHTSARIGDARDTWTHGVVSRINEAAATAWPGLAPGVALMRYLVDANRRNSTPDATSGERSAP